METRIDAYLRIVAANTRRPAIWRIFLTMVLLFLGWTLTTIAILFGAAGVISGTGTSFDAALAEIESQTTILSVFILLATFWGVVLSLWLAIRLMHGMGLRDLLGEGRKLRPGGVALGAGFVAVVMGAGPLIASIFEPLAPNLPVSQWILWLLPALAFLFIQVSAEELIFRGYLQSILAARFRSPVIWLAVPAVLFGAIHYQPQVFGPNVWLVMINAALMGFFAGHVTASTGNISAAIGMHFANNAIGVLFVATPGNLSALSLWLNPVDLSDLAAMRLGLIVNLATVGAAFAVYLWQLRRRDARLQNT